MKALCRRAASTRRQPRSAARRQRCFSDIVFAMSAVLASSGCAGRAALDRRMMRVAETLATVEANGAMRCAPRELAVARSHLEFARLEETRGFPSRASQHLDVAEENVEAANVLSPRSRCATGVAPSGGPSPAGPSP